jgi:hypothetical protein
LAWGPARTRRHVASEKAPFRGALPILLPPVPCFLPADSWAQRTGRAYDKNCSAPLKLDHLKPVFMVQPFPSTAA